jgi:hypothetical protein
MTDRRVQFSSCPGSSPYSIRYVLELPSNNPSVPTYGADTDEHATEDAIRLFTSCTCTLLSSMGYEDIANLVMHVLHGGHAHVTVHKIAPPDSKQLN